MILRKGKRQRCFLTCCMAPTCFWLYDDPNGFLKKSMLDVYGWCSPDSWAGISVLLSWILVRHSSPLHHTGSQRSLSSAHFTHMRQEVALVCVLVRFAYLLLFTCLPTTFQIYEKFSTFTSLKKPSARSFWITISTFQHPVMNACLIKSGCKVNNKQC